MAKGLYQAIRGMKDILPTDAKQWQMLEQTCLQQAHQYGFDLLRTPMVEVKDLFVRSVGEQTDVVTKEMYAFADRNGQECVLRPEGTAPCVRAGIEHGLLYNQVRRLCYLGPMFRRERPQKGRYRQFHTFGAEVFGVDKPSQDVELILLGQSIFQALGLVDRIVCQINCLGDQQSQADFAEALVAYFTPFLSELSDDVAERLAKNPLRVCDSKDPQVIALLADAPVITDFLSPAAQAHYQAVLNLLDAAGVNYCLAPELVRGLDYYSHVVFEWHAKGIGAQAAVGGGGRYNQLVEVLGGQSTPAAGFGLGLERLLMLLPNDQSTDAADVYVVTLDDNKQIQAMLLAEQLRQQGWRVIMDHTLASRKAQFKKAEQCSARVIIMIDDKDELELKNQQQRQTLRCHTQDLITQISPMLQ